MDDAFVVVKKEHVEALHLHLNDQFTGVSFTLEEEKEGSLAFLDVEVKRCQDGSAKTAVFRKVTHTDKYLDINSHHSVQHKESVIRSLVQRGDLYPSDETDKSSERKHIDQTLRANNYPKRFIRRTCRKIQARNNGAGHRQEGERKPMVVLPYIQGVTERITRILAPHAKVANKPGKNLRNTYVS